MFFRPNLTGVDHGKGDRLQPQFRVCVQEAVQIRADKRVRGWLALTLVPVWSNSVQQKAHLVTQFSCELLIS